VSTVVRYTLFAYSGLKLSTSSLPDGDEVAELYLIPPQNTHTPHSATDAVHTKRGLIAHSMRRFLHTVKLGLCMTCLGTHNRRRSRSPFLVSQARLKLIKLSGPCNVSRPSRAPMGAGRTGVVVNPARLYASAVPAPRPAPRPAGTRANRTVAAASAAYANLS
jgi:hypothetical protein